MGVQTITLPARANPLEAVTYLASLATNSQAIDPILDEVRQITSQVNFNQNQPSANDVLRLQAICNTLVAYLTTDESVRSFTQDDLERRLQDRFEGATSHRKLHIKLGMTFAIAVLVAATCLQLQPPASADPDNNIAFYITLTLPAIFTVLSWGAAWLFFSALQYFSAALKRTYIIIAAGVALLGLMDLQMPVLAYLTNLNTGWINDGAVGLLYTPAHVLIFVGTAIFARRIGVHSRFASWPAILIASSIGAVIVLLAHHTPAIWSEAFFDFATSTFAISVAASTASAINCYLIARKINDIYQKPMKWLAHANAMLAFAVGQILFVRLVFGYDNFWAGYGLIILPYFISSVVFLRAGYLFNRVSSY